MNQLKTSKSSLLKLISGTGISQIILFAVTPILTRLYSPSDFGQYEMFISLVNILLVFSTFQYDKALIIPTKRIEYFSLMKGVVLILLGFSIFIVFGFWIFSRFIDDFPTLMVLKSVFWFMPIVIILRSINLVAVTALNREGRFSEISAEKVIRSSSVSGFNIWFRIGDIFKSGLILSELFVGMVSNIYLLFQLRGSVISILFRNWAKLPVKKVLIKYRHFTIYGLPKSIFFSLTANVPILIITYYYGIVEAGIYGLAVRLLSKPVTLLANTSASLFKRDVMLEMQSNGSSINSVYRTLKIQALITVIPFIIGYSLIDLVFDFVFPSEWQKAIVIVKALSIMYFFNTLISPITYVFMIYKKQNIDLILNILLFLFSSVSMVLVNVWFKNFDLSILVYSICYSIFYIVFLVYSLLLSKRNEVYY